MTQFPKPTKRIKVKKAVRRIRKTPIAKLERQLDSELSHYVVKRDQKCVTCGSTQKLGCGHLFSRRARSTRWDYFNCNCQCWPCNFYHTHDTSRYTKWFLDKYGHEVWDALYARFHTPRKWSRADLEFMLDDIKKQIEYE